MTNTSEHLDAGWSTPISSTPGPRRRGVALTLMAGQQARRARHLATDDRDVRVTRPDSVARDLRSDPDRLMRSQAVTAA
jgi:hypothetical protein